MSGRLLHIIQAVSILIVLGFITLFVQSEGSTVSVPDIPEALAGSCVAPPEEMRKNHMNFLKHDRDLKVQDGVTNIKSSLKECVACHVVKDEADMPVSYESPEHFCRSCHEYVAVKIDCFSCHNSKPDADTILSLPNPHDKKVQTSLLEANWSSEWLKDTGDE